MSKTANHVRLQPRPGSLHCDLLVCDHCGANLAMPERLSISMWAAMLKTWNKDHGRCKPNPAVLAELDARWRAQFATPEAWSVGSDRGRSSETIWRAITGKPVLPSVIGVPSDPSDFGRCLRLVEGCGWRDRLSALSDVPGWKPVVDHWDELAALMREEVPCYRERECSGEAPRLYARMKELGL